VTNPAHAPEQALYYFEDVEIGKVLETPSITVTQAHVAMFRGVAGLDAGGAGVPDLLPLCLSSGLGWRLPQPPTVVLAFMGFEWRFLKPTQIGDTIRTRSHAIAKRTLKEGGVVVESREILNHRDEPLQAGKITLLIARRPAS
jgi:acyl dehydratase